MFKHYFPFVRPSNVKHCRDATAWPREAFATTTGVFFLLLPKAKTGILALSIDNRNKALIHLNFKTVYIIYIFLDFSYIFFQ